MMEATPAELRKHQMEGQDVASMLARQAEHRSGHSALIWDPPAGDIRSWTYKQLWHDVRRLSAGLHARGIGVGDKVLLHADNSPELILAWLACATVGAVGVTTNTKSVPEELAWFSKKAQCVAAITQPRYADDIASVGGNVAWVALTEPEPGEAIVTSSDERFTSFEGLFGEARDWPQREPDPLLPYCIMFTSGTTSKPKGVVHTHGNAIWASRTGARNIDLHPEDCYIVYQPFFHANAQTWSVLPVFGIGATLVLVPKWSSTRFWETVQRHGVTHFSLMGFNMATLMASDRPDTTLRVGVFGAIVPDGRDVFGCEIYAAYGMTETVIHTITGKPSEYPEAGSMGWVAPGYELAVVNPSTGDLCERGRPGELWLRGTRGIQLFLEYFDNAEANARSFEDGWFKTGDIVKHTDGGTITYVERDADLLKVGGENVSAREVEDVAGAVAGVGKVAVVGKKHDFLSEVVVAFVIKSTIDASDESALTQHVIETCSTRLASFKVPRAVYYLDEFPMGISGKILKTRLREIADAKPPID